MDEPLRILLIDDDPDELELTSAVLKETMREPYHLDWASSYEKGLDALEHCDHDICLLDYRLGAKTGLDVLRHAAAIQCKSPIVLLTGQGERAIDLEAMEAGAADYLTKNNLPETLERTIRHAIERHRDRRALRQLNEELEQRVSERTRELEKANQSLRDADHKKDEFLAILAHELRNPLAPIANCLELMKAAADDAELIRQSRATIERQFTQMVRLIDDLLDISRVGRGKLELRLEQVDLQTVIEQALETARPLAQKQRHQLNVDLPAEPILLKADPIRLSQVFSNLLNNACKFMQPGGKIWLSAKSQGKDVVVSIRDSGVGIPADKLASIFEMFSQVENVQDRAHGGLGIGLTLVRQLTEMHHGSVEAASAGLGQGSEFSVRLPMQAAPSAKGSAAASPAPAKQSQRRKVLVVDDNVDSATTLSMLFSLLGHETRTANDGAQAIKVSEQFLPDLILLDIGLPILNGYEVASRLRAHPQLKDATLIALTGWGHEDDRRRTKEAGFDRHLVKPADLAVVKQILADFTPVAG
jgi:signal transduction histidine kinase